ncbi:hypothetical protein [Variovorax guangxiensis]|uniref:hypothetical protein n=1 Tax=Variovorax guangxiensis TaxID=1775474 RepID=UPI00286317D0|nr:hypothetical protein [Variovorax guangxiensis]MDR6854915.1 hypothetical protein [Variovorax guangxiensis]
MNTTDVKPSTARLAEVNQQAIARYKEMRALVMPAPGVDAATCETVLAMQLALRGHELPFKVHAMRAMAQSMSLAQLEGLLLAGVGVSLLACEAARALDWLREAHEEFTRSAPAG